MQPLNNTVSIQLSNTENPNLKNVPEEVHEVILSALGHSALGALAQTSKQFKLLSQPLMKKQFTREKFEEIAKKLESNIAQNTSQITAVPSLRKEFEDKFCHEPKDKGGYFDEHHGRDEWVPNQPDERCEYWTCCFLCLPFLWLSTFPRDYYRDKTVNSALHENNNRLRSLITADNERLASLKAKAIKLQPQMNRG